MVLVSGCGFACGGFSDGVTSMGYFRVLVYEYCRRSVVFGWNSVVLSGIGV